MKCWSILGRDQEASQPSTFWTKTILMVSKKDCRKFKTNSRRNNFVSKQYDMNTRSACSCMSLYWCCLSINKLWSPLINKLSLTKQKSQSNHSDLMSWLECNNLVFKFYLFASILSGNRCEKFRTIICRLFIFSINKLNDL